jgi:iron(III) transport system permease protein
MAAVSIPYFGRYRFDAKDLFHWTLLALVIVLVLYPVAFVVLGSFQTGQPGQPTQYTLDAWVFALSDRALLVSLWNTVTLTIARQSIGLIVAILIAWTLARTDIPGSRWLEFLFWIAFFLPTLPVVLGWIMLLDPEYGLVNRVLMKLPFIDRGPFNIYSFWGIVWAHLITNSIAIKVMLLTPAFRNMDASLEEASHLSGANNFWTIIRIVVPIMTPAVTVVLLLAIIHSLQAFEIELKLGFPIKFFVFSTKIYSLLREETPQFPAATALSTMILTITVPLIALQRWAIERRNYETVGGQYKDTKIRLRNWRRPVFILVLAVALTMTVVPFACLIIGTFMKLFGFFEVAEPWTIMHWKRVFEDSLFLASLGNTILLAGGAALTNVVLCTAIGYVVMRVRFRGRATLDFISWLPVSLPGIILGLGLLWLFLGNPVLQQLYGTIFVMILAMVITTMTTAVQIIKSNLAQLGSDLEEAARVSGGSWWHTLWHVVLPLIAPTLLLVGALGFISAARNVSTVILLSTHATRPLALLQLDFMVEGRSESAAVVGVIVVVITTGVALVARMLGLRIGLSR